MMLRGAAFAEVLCSAGGKYEAERIESCFQKMFGLHHEDEGRLGLGAPYRNELSRKTWSLSVPRIYSRFGQVWS